MELLPNCVDDVLLRIDDAYRRVTAAQGEDCYASLVKAESELSDLFEYARELMQTATLRSYEIWATCNGVELADAFTSDCVRITRLRARLESIALSTASDGAKRIQGCLCACDDVESILVDLGLENILRIAQERARAELTGGQREQSPAGARKKRWRKRVNSRFEPPVRETRHQRGLETRSLLSIGDCMPFDSAAWAPGRSDSPGEALQEFVGKMANCFNVDPSHQGAEDENTDEAPPDTAENTDPAAAQVFSTFVNAWSHQNSRVALVRRSESLPTDAVDAVVSHTARDANCDEQSSTGWSFGCRASSSQHQLEVRRAPSAAQGIKAKMADVGAKAFANAEKVNDSLGYQVALGCHATVGAVLSTAEKTYHASCGVLGNLRRLSGDFLGFGLDNPNESEDEGEDEDEDARETAQQISSSTQASFAATQRLAPATTPQAANVLARKGLPLLGASLVAAQRRYIRNSGGAESSDEEETLIWFESSTPHEDASAEEEPESKMTDVQDDSAAAAPQQEASPRKRAEVDLEC